MTRRVRIVAVLGSLLAVLVAWIAAQAPTPTVISGGDIGFRVESQRGGVPVGRLVIRVDGNWIEPEIALGVRRLGSQ